MNINFSDYLNLRENISIDLDFGKTEFIKRFKGYLDYDRGLLIDELYCSKKVYLGKIDSVKFVLRKKRRFMNPNIQSTNAKGRIIEFNGKTRLEIDITGADEISNLGLIIAPISFLILFVIILIKEAYPALIIFIPFAILFLTFLRVIMKKRMREFKLELIENLTQL